MKSLRPAAPIAALWLLCAVALAQPEPAPGPAAPAPPPPLATVNGSPITSAHIAKAVDNQWAAPMLRDLIEDRLIRQEYRRLGQKFTPEMQTAALATEKAKYGDEAGFQRHLRQLGMTERAYTDKLVRDAMLEQLMARENTVSDADVEEYYVAHPEEFAGATQVHLLAIVTTTVEDAYLARERLAGGDRFDVVAKELSVHESREQGGDLGWISPEDLPDAELSAAVFALTENEVSDPIRSGNNYWIALVKETQGRAAASLQEATPAIREKLTTSQSLSREEYLRQLARQADIEVTWTPVSYLTAEYLAYRGIRVFIDDEPLDLVEPPSKLPNGNLMVPAKPVLQAIGARLDWKAAEQSLTASTLTGRVKVVVGSTKALVGDESPEVVDLKQAPVMQGGQLWISPRQVLGALGATVEWDATRNALLLTSPDGDLPSPTLPARGGGLEMEP